jgi:hypothetical protein
MRFVIVGIAVLAALSGCGGQSAAPHGETKKTNADTAPPAPYSISVKLTYTYSTGAGTASCSLSAQVSSDDYVAVMLEYSSAFGVGCSGDPFMPAQGGGPATIVCLDSCDYVPGSTYPYAGNWTCPEVPHTKSIQCTWKHPENPFEL